MCVGMAAGSISTLGFAYLTPMLERKIGLGDTCGVHNLHGIPGILGGLVRLPARIQDSSSSGVAFATGPKVVPHNWEAVRRSQHGLIVSHPLSAYAPGPMRDILG